MTEFEKLCLNEFYCGKPATIADHLRNYEWFLEYAIQILLFYKNEYSENVFLIKTNSLNCKLQYLKKINELLNSCLKLTNGV